MSFMKISLLNPPEELEAFPLNQHLFLSSSFPLESAILENNLVLIRQVDEQGSLRASDLYNTNIGHVKNIYSTVPIVVTQIEEQDGSFRIVCDPVKPLAPASKYLLFLDKELSSEFISVEKTVSKGPSSLELLEVKADTSSSVNYKIKVLSEPTITSTANIVKFQLYVNGSPTRVFTVNSRSDKNKIEFSGISIKVLDTAYATEEEFEIVHKGERRTLEENYVVPFKTSISTTVTPLEGVKPSSALSYEDVVEFYKGLGTLPESNINIDFSKKCWEKEEFSIQYLDENSFILKLNELTTDMLDLDNLDYRQFPAYLRSDLNCISLYDPKLKYQLVPEILDDKTVLFIIEKEGTPKAEWIGNLAPGWTEDNTEYEEEWIP